MYKTKIEPETHPWQSTLDVCHQQIGINDYTLLYKLDLVTK